jgi:hypothetical protein
VWTVAELNTKLIINPDPASQVPFLSSHSLAFGWFAKPCFYIALQF